MFRIDLNSDLGEGLGHYSAGTDEEIISLITSANIACGYHAGDPLIMEQTVELCKKYGVGIGAHPSFPDLMGFGRRNMSVSTKEAKLYIQYQLGALMAISASKGMKISHLKPHGAMYNMAAKDNVLAEAIAEAVSEVDESIILVGLSGSEMIKAGKKFGLITANEVFADRAYNSDGFLVSRTLPHSVIHLPEEACSRMVNLIKTGTIRSIDGKEIRIDADTICVHSDTPSAKTLVENLHKEFTANGIKVTKLTELIK
ncbi:MAG TPA: LamB/YcsF family protein [Lentisphaeria bacterium]|nr:MAG: lactam utilization protein LamB [Lentisphaerae bacterium GWF2_38_69]HBM15595.1 LamB/YcsF family protein [Lentisphaeria bacterium]